MSYQITRANQEELLAFVAAETQTLGWKSDAIAFAVKRRESDGSVGPYLAAAVFENFTGPGRSAEFSFAMTPGHRMTYGLIEAFTNLAFNPRALDLDRLWMMAADENLVSQRAMLAIGARFQYRKQAGASNGSDGIVFLMKRVSASPAAKASTTDERDED